MNRRLLLIALCLIPIFVASGTSIAFAHVTETPTGDDSPPEAVEPVNRRAPPSEQQLAYEEKLDRIPAPERLSDWHDRFSSAPHVAGSEGDRRVIEKMASYMESMGLDVEVHRFWTYLAKPISAQVQIVAEPSAVRRDVRVFVRNAPSLPLNLPTREPSVPGDPHQGHPDLDIGWNAYSGTGDVTGPVVYANYGTLNDFHELRRLGVDVKGKIVIVRYGANFRGFKAKFAEEAGAAGLIIFTDPADSGYIRGATYPDGGWAGAGYIQRGSLKTLPYSGDPLTPFEEATENAERLDPDHVALPLIPVQPIGWGAAFEILRRMEGPTVPRAWQGGLPMTYRLGGGDLRVRLQVKQERELVETANVLGFLRGDRHPDEWVVVGGHHDAWSFGAGDPNAGSILVFEAARAFTDAAKSGDKPDRTVVFAQWGAEEFGIIGSTEWVEGHRDELLDRAVGYINLDGAAMGTQFSASASPSLKALIADAAYYVAQADSVAQAGSESGTVYEAWVGDQQAPPFGNLGGGSDHVSFYCHLGVPSMNLSAIGSPGVSYHSNYENLTWYRQVVGDDYAGAVMLTQLINRVIARLANLPLLPLDPVAYGTDLQDHLAHLAVLANELGMEADFSALAETAQQYAKRAAGIHELLIAAVHNGQLADEGLARANRILRHLERQWLYSEGLPERPWFRNLFAATDPNSGYGAWMLPALRFAVEARRPEPPPLPITEAITQPETETTDSLDTEASIPGEQEQQEQQALGSAENAQNDATAKTAEALESRLSDRSTDDPKAADSGESESRASDLKATVETIGSEEPTPKAPKSVSTDETSVDPETSATDSKGPVDDENDGAQKLEAGDVGEDTDPEGDEKRQPPISLEQAQALYLDALERLGNSLDELQALLPGEIITDPEPLPSTATDDGVSDEPQALEQEVSNGSVED